MLRHLAILQGKLAHKNDEYCYDGTVYDLQYSNKGPVSKARLSEFEAICKEKADLGRQIEKAELKALKEQDEEQYNSYKEELEARYLRGEGDAIESETTKIESAETFAMLNAKLNCLIHAGVEQPSQNLGPTDQLK